MRLHHVALGARDVERVAAFYRDLLGLSERQRHSYADGRLRSIWLSIADDAWLMVEHSEEPQRHVESVAAGPFLLAFRVSPAEREQVEAKLSAQGYAIESRSEFTSYTRDPERNRVAISHYPERAP
ncbi:MAG: VOC family protein [Polyangiaceae bacterium]